MDDALREQLHRELGDSGFDGLLSLDLSRRILDGQRASESLVEVSEAAAPIAHVPVSGFQVGVAAVSASGRIVLGANLEFDGTGLGATVHAEQTTVSVALSAGIAELSTLAVHAEPCGHCRQFLLELGDPAQLDVIRPGRTATLAELLPEPFGPIELGVAELGLTAASDEEINATDPVDAAQLAGGRSHAPYTGAVGGAAVLLADGTIASGSAIESVAYNPSLGPFRAAMAVAMVRGWPTSAIERVVIAEPTGQRVHTKMAVDILAALDSVDVETVELTSGRV